MASKKGMTKLDLGPSGRRVAENVALQRTRLNLTYAALEKRLADAGHRIPALGLRRIEAEARRVDVDDLLSLAFALECTPIVLLTPATPSDPVTAIPEGEFIWEEVRNWISGQVKLTPMDLAAYWSEVGSDSEKQLQHWVGKLEGSKNDRITETLRRRYEQLMGEALQRNELAVERMSHFLDDFDDHSIAASGPSDE